MTRPVVAVVGGGITGLTTGWHLREGAEVTVLEAARVPGGQIRTVDLAGLPFDVGADALLTRQPAGPALLDALSIPAHDVVAPVSGQVHLWIDGRLRPLPAGTVLGVPADLPALARAQVLTPGGTLRAALEPLVPRRRLGGDCSVGELVGGRFGRQVVDRLVEPLLGGVYAGTAASLSASATLPAVWEEAAAGRSLLRGLAAVRRRAAPAAGPVFVTVRGGLGRLIGRLQDDLGGSVRTGVEVRSLQREGDRWRVRTSAGAMVADAVVLAVPAGRAAAVVRQVSADAADLLRSMRVASVGVVGLAYDPSATRRLPPGSGVLVPRSARRLVKAVTSSSRKWPHQADGAYVRLRASVGRVDDTRALDLDDDELAERVDAEVRWMLGITAPAVERVVQRWPAALPQYDVGHRGRVERIRRELARTAPGVHLVGAAFDGVGLSARAAEAQTVAAGILAATAR